jgi:hypothetical protein
LEWLGVFVTLLGIVISSSTNLFEDSSSLLSSELPPTGDLGGGENQTITTTSLTLSTSIHSQSLINYPKSGDKSSLSDEIIGKK